MKTIKNIANEFNEWNQYNNYSEKELTEFINEYWLFNDEERNIAKNNFNELVDEIDNQIENY